MKCSQPWLVSAFTSFIFNIYCCFFVVVYLRVKGPCITGWWSSDTLWEPEPQPSSPFCCAPSIPHCTATPTLRPGGFSGQPWDVGMFHVQLPVVNVGQHAIHSAVMLLCRLALRCFAGLLTAPFRRGTLSQTKRKKKWWESPLAGYNRFILVGALSKWL